MTNSKTDTHKLSVKISIDESDAKRLTELLEQQKFIADEINHILKNLKFKSELL